jgi:hypothetical protein
MAYYARKQVNSVEAYVQASPSIPHFRAAQQPGRHGAGAQSKKRRLLLPSGQDLRESSMTDRTLQYIRKALETLQGTREPKAELDSPAAGQHEFSRLWQRRYKVL